MSPEPTAEKQGNADTLQHWQQQSESTHAKNIEFFDPRLSQLIAIYQQANAAQRDAISEAVETIVAKSDISVGNSS